MAMTLGQVLALPQVQAGHPAVLTGSEHQERPVRWVHVLEGTDVGGLLSGGEVVLTMLLSLPDEPARQRAYIRDLADAGAAGLVVELGRRFAKVPDVMVDESSACGLPLVSLSKVIRFVAVTEAVHARILDEQHDLLRFSQRVHEEFTEIAVEGAEVEEMLERTAALAGTAVVLEDLSHEVVAHCLGRSSATEVLEDWSARSRAVPKETRVDTGAGWLLAPVASRRAQWGRLVLVGPPAVPTDGARMVLERAAQALSMARLVEQDVATVRSRALNRFLGQMIDARSSEADLRAAAKALGLAAATRYLGACVVPTTPLAPDIIEGERQVQTMAEEVAAAGSSAGLSVLAAPLPDGGVGVLVALPGGMTDTTALERLAARLRGSRMPEHVLAASDERTTLAQAGADLGEASSVARAAAVVPGRLPFYRIADIRLRGLLMQMADDPRVTAFAERELGDLLRHDDRHHTGLVDLLRAYLELGGNIAALARRSHLSRQALYARLRTIERLLGADLSDGETRTSLHVALLARQVGRD